VGFDVSDAGLKQQSNAYDDWRKWFHRDLPLSLVRCPARSADAASHGGLRWALSVILDATLPAQR
jgi:hypothetical protein